MANEMVKVVSGSLTVQGTNEPGIGLVPSEAAPVESIKTKRSGMPWRLASGAIVRVTGSFPRTEKELHAARTGDYGLMLFEMLTSIAREDTLTLKIEASVEALAEVTNAVGGSWDEGKDKMSAKGVNVARWMRRLVALRADGAVKARLEALEAKHMAAPVPEGASEPEPVKATKRQRKAQKARASASPAVVTEPVTEPSASTASD